MTQEDKELLLRDLSARLTYGVIVDYKEDEYDFHHWKISTLHAPAYSQSGSLINTDSDGWISTDSDGWIEYNEYKGCGMSSGSRPLHLEITLPFLRSMSSMTEEEKKMFKKLHEEVFMGSMPYISASTSYEEVFMGSMPYISASTSFYDWLNAHHFDYRGLIPMGLALEAPEGMYK